MCTYTCARLQHVSLEQRIEVLNNVAIIPRNIFIRTINLNNNAFFNWWAYNWWDFFACLTTGNEPFHLPPKFWFWKSYMHTYWKTNIILWIVLVLLLWNKCVCLLALCSFAGTLIDWLIRLFVCLFLWGAAAMNHWP